MALWLSPLKSKNVEARRKVVERLCANPSGRALRTLKEALEDDDAEVRRLAATALGKLEDDACLDPLLQALRDSDPEVQKHAIQALKRFTGPKAIEALIPLLRSHDAGVRGHAAQALEALHWHPSEPEDEIWFWSAKGQFFRLAPFGAQAIPTLEVVLETSSYSQCVKALQALGQIDDPGVLRPLLRGLKSADSAVAVASANALARSGGPQAIQHLAGMLIHKNGQVRLAAVEGLAELRASGVAEPLRRLLNDELWEVRKAAAETLGRLKDTEAIEPLAHALNDKDTDVREAAAVSLGRLGNPKAIGPLVMSLKDMNSGVRRMAAAALSRIDENWNVSPEGRLALEALRPALQDKDSDVRHFISHILAGLGDALPESAATETDTEAPALDIQDRRRKLAIGLFLAILCDQDRDLRQAAAEALGQLGSNRAQAGLLRAVADSDPGVRHAAEASLRILTETSGGNE